MKYVTAKHLEEGDTITLPDNEDYIVNEKTTEINGMVGLLVSKLGKGTQHRKYIDPDDDVAVVESKADRQARREAYQSVMGDSTDVHYQNKRERKMGL